MPLYEYQCEKCGHRFEVIQKFSDPLVSVCPQCAGPVHKLQSAPAFQFKGSGWYVTDYGKKGESAKSDAAKTDTSKAAPKSDAASSETISTPAATPSSTEKK